MKDIIIGTTKNFSAVNTFECGQCFRWDKRENGEYFGVVNGYAAVVCEKNGNVYIKTDFDNTEFWRNYFDCGRDYGKIGKILCGDDFTEKAVSFGKGMRILRQDAWESLCSFIISQCNNIKRIKGIIANLCKLFGNEISFCGEKFYSFPDYRLIAELRETDLAPLHCGYRAPYIISAAKAVACGQVDFDTLNKMPLADARKEIMKLSGVGAKVADCFLLFGLGKTDAFPVDTWMKKAAKYYNNNLNAERFGEYAGFAQQYIFYYIRSGLGEK